MAVSFQVNGETVTPQVDPTTPLLYVLRDNLGLKGPRFGCGLGECGACTVVVGGQATRSCLIPVGTLQGQAVTTLEGLGTPERPHPVQQAFIDAQAAQCGYCSNGMIMTAKAFLDKNPHPSEAQVRQALAGNLCRCGTHLRIMKAVLGAASGQGAST